MSARIMSKDLLWVILKVVLEVIVILIDFYINVK